MTSPPGPAPWIPPLDRRPRILLVKLSALGDVIHALPVLASLAHELPDARIDWVVEDRSADLLRGRPELDRLVVLPRNELSRAGRRPWRLLRPVRDFIRTLRARRYDVALDLQGNLKSGVVARLSGARHRYGIARAHAREGNHLFTTHRATPDPARRHRVERNLGLLSALLGRPTPWRDPGWPADRQAADAATRLLEGAGLPREGYALLHPGTSRFGAFKRWPPARFADLARRLNERGETVVVIAPPGEEDLAEAVAALADGAVRELAVPDLGVLAEVTRRARIFVAGDTGPLHLAALAGTPVVGLFGPKAPEVYGPYGGGRGGRPGLLPVLVRDDVTCRPCSLRACPDPVCMTGLGAEAVLAEIDARSA